MVGLGANPETAKAIVYGLKPPPVVHEDGDKRAYDVMMFNDLAASRVGAMIKTLFASWMGIPEAGEGKAGTDKTGGATEEGETKTAEGDGPLTDDNIKVGMIVRTFLSSNKQQRIDFDSTLARLGEVTARKEEPTKWKVKIWIWEGAPPERKRKAFWKTAEDLHRWPPLPRYGNNMELKAGGGIFKALGALQDLLSRLSSPSPEIRVTAGQKILDGVLQQNIPDTWKHASGTTDSPVEGDGGGETKEADVKKETTHVGPEGAAVRGLNFKVSSPSRVLHVHVLIKNSSMTLRSLLTLTFLYPSTIH